MSSALSIDEILRKPVVPVIAKPGASKTEITGVRADALLVTIAAPPEDGKANEALCKFLKKLTGRPCSVLAGASSRKKLVKWT